MTSSPNAVAGAVLAPSPGCRPSNLRHLTGTASFCADEVVCYRRDLRDLFEPRTRSRSIREGTSRTWGTSSSARILWVGRSPDCRRPARGRVYGVVRRRRQRDGEESISPVVLVLSKGR